MELKINLDESRFKDIVDKELEALTKEEIHDIMKEAIKNYLLIPEHIEKLFYVANTGYNRASEPYAASFLLSNLFNSLDVKSGIEDLKEKVMEFLKTDENVQKIIGKMMYDMFMKNISSAIFNSSDFMLAICKLQSH